jgi:hypothetical protein
VIYHHVFDALQEVLGYAIASVGSAYLTDKVVKE